MNAPLVLAALLSTVVDYKMKKLSRNKYTLQLLVWIIILVGLALAKSIYEFLFSNNLTQTEPLSLFDVIQITGIITILYTSNRSRIKIESLEKRVQDLHQELSIRLSESATKKK